MLSSLCSGSLLRLRSTKTQVLSSPVWHFFSSSLKKNQKSVEYSATGFAVVLVVVSRLVSCIITFCRLMCLRVTFRKHEILAFKQFSSIDAALDLWWLPHNFDLLIRTFPWDSFASKHRHSFNYTTVAVFSLRTVPSSLLWPQLTMSVQDHCGSIAQEWEWCGCTELLKPNEGHNCHRDC